MPGNSEFQWKIAKKNIESHSDESSENNGKVGCIENKIRMENGTEIMKCCMGEGIDSIEENGFNSKCRLTESGPKIKCCSKFTRIDEDEEEED